MAGCGPALRTQGGVMSDARKAGFRRLTVNLCLAASVCAFSVLCTYGIPRPYGLQEIDSENAYYYGGRVLLDGLPMRAPNLKHPGIPTQIAAAGLLWLIGDGPEDTQAVLDAGRLLVGIASGVALLAYLLLLPGSTPPSIRCLLAATIVAAPPFLTYLDYFSGAAFTVPLTLPALALLWSAVIGDRPWSLRLLGVAGALFGAAAAAKVTVVPVLLASCAAVVPPLWRSATRSSLPRLAVVVLPASAASVFLLFVLLVAPPRAIAHVLTASREVVSKPGDSSAVVAALHRLGDTLSSATTTMPLLSALALCSTLFAAWAFFATRRVARREAHPSGAARRERVASSDATVFLALLLLAATVALASTTSNTLQAPGVVFRYLLPGYLVIPFLVHFGFLYGVRTPAGRAPRRIALVLAGLLFAAAPTMHTLERSRAIDRRAAIERDLGLFIESSECRGDRVGLWLSGDNPSGAALADAAFHFWGNTIAGDPSFEDGILDAFPSVTYFNLRRALAAANESRALDEYVAGEGALGLRPSLFLLPRNELERRSPELVVELLAGHFGQPYVARRVTARAADWLAIEAVQCAR